MHATPVHLEHLKARSRTVSVKNVHLVQLKTPAYVNYVQWITFQMPTERNVFRVDNTSWMIGVYALLNTALLLLMKMWTSAVLRGVHTWKLIHG
jgi:hypothetical protein